MDLKTAMPTVARLLDAGFKFRYDSSVKFIVAEHEGNEVRTHVIQVLPVRNETEEMRHEIGIALSAIFNQAREGRAAMLAAFGEVGFVQCTFFAGSDACDCCRKNGRQLYFRSVDVSSDDGEYWCRQCVEKHIAEYESHIGEIA